VNPTGMPNDAAIDEIIMDLLHSVRMALGMEVAFVSEFTGDTRIFRYVDSTAGFAPLTIGQSSPLTGSYCQLVCDGMLPQLVRNAQVEPGVQHIEATHALPVGAHLSVPIRFSDGSLYGTFCCFSRYPDATLNERDLSVLRTFAEFATRTLERNAAAQTARARIRTRLEQVTRMGEFVVHYQPLVNLVLDRSVGYEALARFPHEPSRAPDSWFQDALKAGMHEALELAVIRRALAVLPRLPADHYLSINVSPETILAGQVEDTLKGLPLERIVLEVTEHSSVIDYAPISEQLEPLRRAGLRLAVDDAGAGFASFRHILKLRPDIIKLDASLIHRIDIDQGSRALAAALIRFADEIGSHVVAEGVETAAELRVLRELKVNEAQGFLLGRPEPMEA